MDFENSPVYPHKVGSVMHLVTDPRAAIWHVIDRLHEVGLDADQISYALDMDARVIKHFIERGEPNVRPEPQTNS